MMLLLCLAIAAYVSQICSGLESPEPEVSLQPRNFNPHPYQNSLSSADSSRRGPVLFPEAPTRERVRPTTARPILSIGLPDVQSTGAENHPYANVARKQRIKLAGRFSRIDQENDINPQVYTGLANYAAKVLKKPGGGRQNIGFTDDITLSGQKKDYTFSYTVRDRATGDDFSHKQSQDSSATHGEYRVKLPDGRIQIVSYTADKNGYKADVKYMDDFPPELSKPKQPVTIQATPILPASVPQRIPIADYDYNYDQNIQYGQNRGGNPLTQIEIPLYDDNPQGYQIQTVTPKYYQSGQKYVTVYPLLDELHRHSQQYIPHDKVEIYPQGEQSSDVNILPQTTTSNPPVVHRAVTTVRPPYDGKLLNIGGATLISYPNDQSLKDYERNILVSTVAPVANQYSDQLYVTTPRYNVLQTTQQYYKKR